MSSTPSILLLCATKPEWAEIRTTQVARAAGDWKIPCYELSDWGVTLVQTGIGPARTGQALKSIENSPRRFDAVIQFGLSGALKEGMAAGDLVLVREIVNESGNRMVLERDFLNEAETVLKALGQPFSEGVLFTSASVLPTPEEKRKCGEGFSADIVDMESHPVASFCFARGIRYLSVRAVFDPLDWDLSALEGAVSPEGNLAPAGLALGLAKNPKAILSLPRFNSAATRANKALARFVGAFIERNSHGN